MSHPIPDIVHFKIGEDIQHCNCGSNAFTHIHGNNYQCVGCQELYLIDTHVFHFTSLPEVTYDDKIGKALSELEMHGIFDIEKKVKADNQQEFIRIVNSYIDRNFGKEEGWELTFSTDQKKIKKIQRYKKALSDGGKKMVL